MRKAFRLRRAKNTIRSNTIYQKDGIASDCVFCSTETKSLSHLVGGSLVVEAIWRKVYEWIGLVDDLSLEEFEGFLFDFEKVKNLAKRSLVTVIWLATAWSIWNRRNGIIFKNDSFSFTECFVQQCSEKWTDGTLEEHLLDSAGILDPCAWHGIAEDLDSNFGLMLQS
ncbi:uncharacterized protein LOC131651357 [Vicia villosa]|uniref:uncharacterized protein LOC131651357 n=1 Tax=Vicia villosa TaxID=3911 RepID=UPI00273AAEE9|nr:uncharacterized protein LOC131651357 [Vicia villosa]